MSQTELEQNPSLSSQPTQEKSNNPIRNNKFLFIIGTFILTGVLLAIWFFSGKGIFNLNTPVRTDPVPFSTGLYHFNGNIEQINGSILTVSETIYQADTAPVTENASPKPPVLKKTTYLVNITSETGINIIPLSIPYSFKSASPSATPVPDISGLHTGQRITGISKQDLNTLKSNAFEAASVTVYPQQSTLTANIDNVSNDELTVTASPPSVPESKQYVLKVDKETEIVSLGISLESTDSAKPSEPTVLTISDLKKDDRINIYAQDLDQNSKVLKIEVIPNMTIKQ